MRQCTQNSRLLHWLSGSLLGLCGCLGPVPAQQGATSSTGNSSTQATQSTDKSSSTKQSTSSPSEDQSSTTQDEESESQESKKQTPPGNGLRRLTATQVRNALKSVFAAQDETSFEAALALPTIYNNDAFSNDTRYQVISPESLAKIQDSAERIGSYIATHNNARELSGCKASDSEQVCIQTLIGKAGAKLFRRPLEAQEISDYQAIYRNLASKGSDADALAGLIQALVSSPHFHYLPPRLEPDQHAYLVAARLSLFLWNDLPDQALTQAAKDKTLLEAQVLAAQAERMLASPKAAATIQNFYLQMLRLGALPVRSHAQVPVEHLANSFAQHITRIYEQGTLDALWTLPVQLDGPELAEHFPGQYPGLLAHPIFNWIHAKPTYSDPIARGAVIREQVFCNALRAPPPDVQMLLPAPQPDATTRERFEIHRKDPSCAGCHSLIDPLGFGLEAYDHQGRFRDEENNKPIDDKGALVATDVNGAFQGVAQLSKKLVQSGDVRSCLAEQWLSYAAGRPLKGSDQELLKALIETLANEKKPLRAIILSIATSDIITKQEPKP